MTFQDIVYVLTIVQEKSFSKAAARLYVTQPAISQAIAKLEQELGVTLFFRKKQVQPTQACLAFVEKAQPVMQMYQQFCSDMKQLKHTNEGRMRIGVSSFFSRFLSFQKQVMQSPQKYPFEIEIIEDVSAVIEQMTIDGKVDFCFTRYPLYHSELQYEPLYTEQIFLAVPSAHPVCEKYPATEQIHYPTVNLADFKDSSFVMIKNSFVTPQCEKMYQEAGFVPHVVATTTVWERVLQNISALDVVGFISCVYARPYAPDTPIRFFRIDSSHASLENVVAYISKENLPSNARTYINAFREYVLSKIPI